MPEGPEIHRAADSLSAVLTGRTLTRAWFAFPELKPHEKRLRGREVLGVEARGKAIVTRFDNGWTLYSHNQLYGQWRVLCAGEEAKTTRSLRVALETDQHRALLFSASDVELIRDEDLDQQPYLARLGPDALDPATTHDDIRAQLINPRFSGRSLAALLLDQGFVAGMGNYLRAEVLFDAGIAAHHRPRDLDDDIRARLANALLAIPRHSYRTRGVERIGAGMRADLQYDDGERFRFRVFGRDGKPCERCGTAIVRSESAGRRLYCCPKCQQ
ncbi:MAG: endonuclease VIII [Xanthomonadales bacterium]|nr:endonuclease VIII [Xanthomonadales bacterium]